MSVEKKLAKAKINHVIRKMGAKPLFAVQKLLFHDDGNFEFTEDIEIFTSKDEYKTVTGHGFIEGRPLRARGSNWGIMGFTFRGRKRQQELLKLAQKYGCFERFYTRMK